MILLARLLIPCILSRIGSSLPPQDAPRSMRELVEALGEGEIEARERASIEILARWKVWAQEDLQLLSENRTRDPEVVNRIQEALGRIRIRRTIGETILRTVDTIESALYTLREEDLLKALASVGDHFTKGHVPASDVVSLLQWIKDHKTTERVREVVQGLEKQGLKADPELVLPLLKEADPFRRVTALETLTRLRARHLSGEIVPLLKDVHPDVRQEAKRALIRLRARDQAGKIVLLLADRDAECREVAARILGAIGAREAARDLLPLLTQEHFGVRLAALQGLTQLGARETAPEIVPLLEDRDPAVRREAALALGLLGGVKEASRISALLDSEKPFSRAAAAAALGEIGFPEGGARLVARLADQDAEVRWCAARALGRLGERGPVSEIVRLLEDPDRWVRAAAIEALGVLGNTEASGKLAEVASGKDSLLREYALEALGRMGASDRIDTLTRALSHPEARTRAVSVQALGRVCASGHLDDPVALLQDPEAIVRENAIAALEMMKARQHLDQIRPLLRDKEGHVRKGAAGAIAALGGPTDLAELAALFEDPYPWVRAQAALAVGTLGAQVTETSDREKLIFKLRAVEMDVEDEVELAAAIGLLRLGAKDRAAQRMLLEDVRFRFSSHAGGLVQELLEALAWSHEKETCAKWRQPLERTSALDSLKDLESFAKRAGMKWDPASRGRLYGRIAAGPSLSLRDVARYYVVPRGFVLQDGELILTGTLEALDYWYKRLSN
jgi:HEAT repeat protein